MGQNKTKHGYYVSQALLQRRNDAAGSLPRVSAPVVDEAVLRCVRALQFGCREAAHALSDRPDSATKVRATVRKIVVSSVELRIDCVGLTPTKGRSNAAGQLQHIEEQLPAGAEILQTDRGLQILLPGRLQRRGGAKRIEGWSKQDWSVVTPRHDKVLLGALGCAHVWREGIERGEITSIETLAKRENLNRRQVSRLLRLAFLAPDIQKAIVDGRQPAGFNLKRLSEIVPPVAWDQQRRQLGLND